MRSDWPPRARIEAESARRGQPAFAASCAGILGGDYSDTRLITILGGNTAPWALDRDRGDWYRVWAARGLLWSWHDSALPALTSALTDHAWRVREMSAKVIARHLLGDTLPALAPLLADPIPRVRTAATRALTRLTQTGA